MDQDSASFESQRPVIQGVMVDKQIKKGSVRAVYPEVDDACVYTKGQGKEMSSLIVHVDNFIIAAPSDAEWPELNNAAEMLKEWNTALSIAVYSEMNNSQREELAYEVMTLPVSYAF
ncbi:hypothetical protein PENARI_c012G05053 [Penicillium arizonense]|uniref:Uncharacterized protein n=1 Tax=Penicillium arizonense TaxID=1835702 RepID=A0A1F5LEY8_PENAI|nr:hypothetical protein PENARI_c012G05053 [Penicillium arizonense]OGE51626.1 hypothetical protein PENARI_c012G05053 [Penicillium arizonense]